MRLLAPRSERRSVLFHRAHRRLLHKALRCTTAIVASLLLLVLDVQGAAADPAAAAAPASRHDEIQQRLDEGKYGEAVKVAREAAVAAEKAKPRRGPEFAAALVDLGRALHHAGSYEEARDAFERSRRIRETALGATHPLVAEALLGEGEALTWSGDPTSAKRPLENALEIRRKMLDKDHPDVADALAALAEMSWVAGNRKGGEQLALEALEIHRRKLGERNARTVRSSQALAFCRLLAGRYEEADKLLKGVLSTLQETRGPLHPALTLPLALRGATQLNVSQFVGALPFADRAVEIGQKTLGATHPHVGLALALRGTIKAPLGKHGEASTDIEAARRIFLAGANRQSILGMFVLQAEIALQLTSGEFARAEATAKAGVDFARSRVGVSVYSVVHTYFRGKALLARAAYPEAEKVLLEARTAGQQVFFETDPLFNVILSDLATVYMSEGKFTLSQGLFDTVLKTQLASLPPRHVMIGQTLNAAGVLALTKADFLTAAKRFRAARDIFVEAVGPDAPAVGATLTSLGVAYTAQNDLRSAEDALQQAVRILEREPLKNAVALAKAQSNLGNLYSTLSQPARARKLFDQALAANTSALGPDSANNVEYLVNRGAACQSLEDFACAWADYDLALAIAGRAYGPKHPALVAPLLKLADYFFVSRDTVAMETALQRALAIAEGAFGPSHPMVAFVLSRLGMVYSARGDRRSTTVAYERALQIAQTTLPPDHIDTAAALFNLADSRLAEGDVRSALTLRSDGTNRTERWLATVLSSGPERRKRDAWAARSTDLDAAISLALRSPDSPAASELALRTVLQRKGRVLDIMTDIFASARSAASPEDRKLLDEWSSLGSQLSAQMLRGPEGIPVAQHKTNLEELRKELDAIEATLSRRNASFRALREQAVIEAVQAAIPGDAALVEWITYRPHDPRNRTYEQWGPSRYAACVLRSSGQPVWLDLGDAESIENQVHALRRAVGGRQRHVKDVARELDARVLAPVLRRAGSARRIFAAPDAELNLVPLGALVGENGRYRIQDHTFTLLTSGRDMLRLRSPVPARSAAVVIADPAFDSAPRSGSAPADLTRGDDGTPAAGPQLHFSRLEATREEARSLNALLSDARLWTREFATERAVKALHGPRLLHIATHGFFLDAAAAGGAASNPLVRSGLAMAGANLWNTRGPDGILTALEASTLDLNGTRLVVLSACETGLGQVKIERDENKGASYTADGVYGLRRALVIAGSETQVMSLWKVKDFETSQLMVTYYTNLAKGQGRTEAMRQAQLGMLRQSETAHPYFWAPFVVSGNDEPVSSGSSGENLWRVPPSGRGCQCTTAETDGDGASAAALLAAAALIGARARRWSRRRWRQRSWSRACQCAGRGVAAVAPERP